MRKRKEIIKTKRGWHGKGTGECPHKGRPIKVQPIRKRTHIKRIKRLLKDNPRDYALFVVGINTYLRGSDLLRLKWRDVLDEDYDVRSRLKIKENKTGKFRTVALSQNSRDALTLLFSRDSGQPEPDLDDYVFPSRKGGRMSIQRLHQMINEWTDAVGLREENYGTHTLRKTFAYHVLKRGYDLTTLCDMMGHSSPAVTLRYAGITQEDRDKIVLSLNL